MLSLLIIPWLILSHLIIVNNAFDFVQTKYLDEEKQFGVAASRCEFAALRLGTEISDVFNALELDKSWNDRVFQDYIVKNLGFAPWLANGIPGTGLTFTNKNAREIHKEGKWIDYPIEESPYAILNHKWIYMFGDSTTRQVWASYAAPFKGNRFERNAKEWTRHYCNKQEHRTKHAKHGFFPEEGWGGPCGVNEVTCHISGYGDQGVLTFDWKHFPYEDYDEYLWGPQGPWINGFPGEKNRRPDVLTVQMGLHSCWHASVQGLYSSHLHENNHTMIDHHIQGIWKLMASIRTAIDSDHIPDTTNLATSPRNPTTVIIVTSGSVGMEKNGTDIDDCILSLNRVVTEAAHSYGFVVLDRGEIERRFMSKSIFSRRPFIPVDMHLVQPVQNIIATCLLRLYQCISEGNISQSRLPTNEQNATMKYPIDLPMNNQIQHGNSRPLHTPPQ